MGNCDCGADVAKTTHASWCSSRVDMQTYMENEKRALQNFDQELNQDAGFDQTIRWLRDKGFDQSPDWNQRFKDFVREGGQGKVGYRQFAPNKSDAKLLEELKTLREANKKLRDEAAGLKPIKVTSSQKGAVSVYGVQRFPVTLYKDQWLRLLAEAEKIKQYVYENDEKLTSFEEVKKK